MGELGVIIKVLLMRQYSDTLQLPLQSVLCKSGLCDIGSIQAVHTVRSDDSGLSVSWLGCRGVTAHVDMEVTHLSQILMQSVYEQLDTMESQPTALVVEIKVDVMGLGLSASL